MNPDELLVGRLQIERWQGDNGTATCFLAEVPGAGVVLSTAAHAHSGARVIRLVQVANASGAIDRKVDLVLALDDRDEAEAEESEHFSPDYTFLPLSDDPDLAAAILEAFAGPESIFLEHDQGRPVDDSELVCLGYEPQHRLPRVSRATTVATTHEMDDLLEPGEFIVEAVTPHGCSGGLTLRVSPEPVSVVGIVVGACRQTESAKACAEITKFDDEEAASLGTVVLSIETAVDEVTRYSALAS